jgi:hypothetical protein
MNANKKFGLKRATQVRDLAEFTQNELDEINSVQREVDMEDGDSKSKEDFLINKEKNELIVNK